MTKSLEMKETTSRIYFKDNPYPNGHKIKEFTWNARLDPARGILFDFHLETEKYNAEDKSEDPEDVEPASDWKAKIVWNNYHQAKISSSFWHEGGILVVEMTVKAQRVELP